MNRELSRSDSTFYLIMSVVSAALLFVGFAPSFYLRGAIPAPVPPLSALTLTHGLVFTAWIILFIAQAALIQVNRPALHRQLGILLAILFGAMLTLGYSTGITAGRLGHIPPGAPPPMVFMALPLIGLTGTLALVAPALLYRRHADWHKRLMLAAMISLTAPGSGRIAIPLGLVANQTWVSLGVGEVLLAIAIGYDVWRHKKVHPAYIVAIVVFAAVHVGIAWAYGSPAWLAFARFLTRG